jgi:hypothetical protein
MTHLQQETAIKTINNKHLYFFPVSEHDRIHKMCY